MKTAQVVLLSLLAIVGSSIAAPLKAYSTDDFKEQILTAKVDSLFNTTNSTFP